MFDFYDPTFLNIFGTLFIISTIFISFSNGLVLLTFLSRRRLCTYFNYFSIGIALADFVVGACTLPSLCIQLFLGYWPLDPSLCSVFSLIDHVSTHSSILCVVGLSYDRLISLAEPLWHVQRQTTRRVLTFMCLAYGLSLILWLPFEIHERVVYGSHPSGECIPLIARYAWFGIFLSIIFFWIPLLAIIILNLMTYYVIKVKRAKRKSLFKPPSSTKVDSSATSEVNITTGDNTKNPNESSLCGKNIETNTADPSSESAVSAIILITNG